MSSPPSQGLKLDLEAQRAMIRKSFHQLGYDLPLFYFSISSYVVPDTFVRMPDPVKRKSLIQIAYASAQPELTYRTLEYVEQRYGLSNPFIGQDAGTQLSIRKDLKMLESDPVIKSALTELNSPPVALRILKFVPRFSFSMNNQFHYWLFGSNLKGFSDGVLKGDLGKSLVSGMKVTSLIKYPFIVSFFIAVIVLLFSLPVGILAGISLAARRNNWITRTIISSFIFFYNIPSFLFAIAMVFLFANPDFLNVFPSSGPVLNTSEGIFAWLVSIVQQWNYLVLPVFILSSSSCVYVAQLVYETLLDELRKPYAMTLLATGYDEKIILRKQLLKNAVIPVLVTMINLFPSLISGALLIDYFFSLNGLGGVLVKANELHDLPVLAGVFVLTGLISVLSFFVSDYLLRKLDPRVNLRMQNRGGEE